MSINLDLLDNLKGKFVEGECLEERKGEREMGGEREAEKVRTVMRQERKGDGERKRVQNREAGRESTVLLE